MDPILWLESETPWKKYPSGQTAALCARPNADIEEHFLVCAKIFGKMLKLSENFIEMQPKKVRGLLNYYRQTD